MIGRFLQTAPAPATRVRLLCVPYAGGGAAQFYAWARDLPRAVQVCPVHLPGRENRLAEPPFTGMSELVEALAGEGGEGGTVALFGHSLGALIAFELARVLCRAGRAPAHLFVSGSRAPQLPRRSPPLYQLDDVAFLEAVQRRYQPLPAVVLEDPQLLALFLPALRADFTLFDTYAYQPGESLDCPLTALGGDADPQVGPDDLAGWREQTRGPFRVGLFSGDHFYLRPQQGPLLRAVAADLAPWLGRLTSPER